MSAKLTDLPSTIGRKDAYYLVLFGLIYAFVFPQYSWAYFLKQKNPAVSDYSLSQYGANQLLNIGVAQNADGQLMVLGGNTLVQVSSPVMPIKTGHYCSSQSRFAIVTAYSSSPDETDASPFITASGTRTRDGIIAANFLNFGTRVKIPALYGEKVFVVEDRMAAHNSGKVDIWMPSKSLAIQFGVRRAEIVVLD